MFASVARTIATRGGSLREIEIVASTHGLAFPGVFRGLLDSGRPTVTAAMELAAAEAIAECVSPEARSREHILPFVLDPSVVPAVARAVMRAAS